MRLGATRGRRALTAVLVALVGTLAILSVVLPFVGGGAHGVSVIP
jgi:hypothetical protein